MLEDRSTQASIEGWLIIGEYGEAGVGKEEGPLVFVTLTHGHNC